MRKSPNAPLRDLGAVLLVVCPLSKRVLADDGTIVFCGNRGDLPGEFGTATVHDHRPGYLLPGFVDSHIHFPQTYAGDSYAGGQLLEWLNLCIFPSEANFADPEFAAQAAVELPGHEGTVQLPADQNGEWMSMVRLRTGLQLSQWMRSAQRTEALSGLRSTLSQDFATVSNTTPFVTTVRIEDGRTLMTPNWKSAMLVLLVL